MATTSIYFDNAATTPIDQEVLKEMILVMEKQFGNPSSIHGHGREARTIVERARKTIANLFHAAPSEFIFTSGGTEANNMAITRSVVDYQIKQVITSPIEHHVVLHILETLEKNGLIRLSFVSVDAAGNINLKDLEALLKSNERTLVSLMHANNEIGTLTDIVEVGNICARYQAIFHCDTVQTVGHYRHDIRNLKAHFLVCSAHKFHGPKGIGFLYINPQMKINPMLLGGPQERNMRAGTENVYGIVGLAKALEIAYREMEAQQDNIQILKSYMIDQLKMHVPGVAFNGETQPEKSLYTVLNVSFPETAMGDMFLFNLDIAGISASSGSACTSGADTGSHVLNVIGANPNRPSVRFSFSKYNKKEEVDFVVRKIREIYANKAS